MTDLPGNVSRGRAIRLLVLGNRRSAIIAVVSAIYLYAFLRSAVWGFGAESWLAVAGYIALLVGVNAINAALARRRFGPVRVTPARQPALAALVEEAARRIGVPVPARIWIISDADAGVSGPARRRGLGIGFPLIMTMSASDLRAGVARELAIMQYGRLSLRLYRLWKSAKDSVGASEDPSRAKRRDRRVVDALDPLGTEIAAAGDRAAATMVGTDAAMIATARAEYLGMDFLIFRALLAGMVDKRVAGGGLRGCRYKIEDLHDGWYRRCQAGVGLPESDAANASWALHPYFAPLTSTVAGRPVSIVPSSDAVALVPLTSSERRRLASAATPVTQRRQTRRWRTFATAPAELWRRDAVSTADGVIRAVAKVLGHDPVDTVEAADVVRSRPVDVSIAQGWADGPEDVDPARAAAGLWLDLLDGGLLDRGWLRVDPAVPGILRGDGGTVVDGRALTVEAVTDDKAYATLRALMVAANVSLPQARRRAYSRGARTGGRRVSV